DVPKTAALAEQAAYSRKGVDLLVEEACNQAVVPCHKEDDPGFSVTTGYEKKQGFDYFIAHHHDHQLKSLGPLKVKKILAKQWSCVTGKAARTFSSGQRTMGIRWPDLADLRQRFEAKYGTQHWAMNEDTEWIEHEEW